MNTPFDLSMAEVVPTLKAAVLSGYQLEKISVGTASPKPSPAVCRWCSSGALKQRLGHAGRGRGWRNTKSKLHVLQPPWHSAEKPIIYNIDASVLPSCASSVRSYPSGTLPIAFTLNQFHRDPKYSSKGDSNVSLNVHSAAQDMHTLLRKCAIKQAILSPWSFR